MMMVMGLMDEDWHDVYRLWKHEKVREPNDLFELLAWWRGIDRESPEACFKVGAKLAECKHTDSSFMAKLMMNFLERKQ